MKERLNGLDLFSGIGGNTLGLREWIKTVAYCEQDKHAQSVLLSRMADGWIESAPIWDDVSTLNGDMFDIPIDIIIAGFPCQDISVAGKGAGLAGERSGLFFEIMRLVKEIKPTFLFLENVPAIRTRGLDTVIQELTEAGYDCRWTMLSAADVGAKHKRERWFCLAANTKLGKLRQQSGWSGGQGWEEEIFAGIDGETQFMANSISQRIWQDVGAVPGEQDQGYETWRDGSLDSGSDVADTVCDGFFASEDRNSIKSCNDEQPSRSKRSTVSERRPTTPRSTFTPDATYTNPGSIEPYLGGVADGLSHDVVEGRPEYLDPSYWEEEPEGIPRVTQEKDQRVERIKRLGNGVVPLQAKTAFKFLLGITKT